MYLTRIEHEAFVRGKTAGLIPQDYPIPKNDREIDELSLHIGIMFSRKFAYRDKRCKLRIATLTAFTEEHLNDIIRNISHIRHNEVLAVTEFQQETYCNALEGLYNYFALGAEIVAECDLAGRISAYNPVITKEQILKGFELDYRPVPQTGLATAKQKAVLTEMICNGRLPTLSNRKWENMTKEEACKLISSAPKPKLPIPIALILSVIRKLNTEERTLLDKLIMQNNDERKIAC